MRVLLLGPESERLIATVEETGDHPVRCDERLSVGDEQLEDLGIVVSYGYRFIIGEEVLDRMPSTPYSMNMHISLLPWNRGADPNLWSVLEDTPSGVTIHTMARDVDAGEILLQEAVEGMAGDTLRTLYERLASRIESLFEANWSLLREGAIAPFPQRGKGSLHRLTDKEPYEALLTSGWDTPVALLRGAALNERRD